MDELQILVKAIVDDDSKQGMDTDLAKLARDLGNAHKIELKVGLDDKSVKTVQSQLQAIAKKVNTSTAGKGSQIKVFDSKKLQADGQKYFRGVKDIVSRAQKEFSKMGKVDITNVFKDAQGNIQSFSANVTKADGVVEKFNFELAKIKHTSKAFSGFVQTNSILSDKSAGTELEKTLNFLNRIDNKIADITSKTLVNTSKPLLADMEQYNQYQTKLTSVKRRIEEIKKANTTLSTDHKREIASMIADLQRYAGELQRSAYASTDLKAATFANKKAELQAALQTDIQKWTNAGIFGGDFEAAVNKAKKQLDDAVDSKDLDEYRHKLKLLIQDFKQLKLDNSASNQILNNDRLNTNLETARLRLQNLKKTYSSFVSDPDLLSQWEALFDSSYVVTTQKELTNLNAEIRQFEQRLISAGKHSRNLFDELKANAAKMGTWMVLGGVLAGVMRGVTGIGDAVVDLNTAMTELKKVTNETDEAYDGFLTSAADKAVEIGTSYSNLVTSTSSFARLGYTMEDAASLAEVANIYSVVGDEVGSIDEATNSIISTMKAFGIEAENAMTIVDKFNKIGNEFAISSGGIGSAMQRSASAMAAANNTIDQSIALMVAANNVIQDPDVVGTMWKTVSMRIRGAVTELEDAGLETEAMAESTASLQKKVKALTNVDDLGGFDIMADAENFKSTYDIILGISKVWKDMSDIDQAALLELLAGKRQGNALAAAITNMKDAVNVLKASSNAEGSAMKEHERWMESIQAKQKVFQAQYEKLAATFLSSELVTFVYDAGTGILGFLTDVTDLLGSLPTLITAVTPFFDKMTLFRVTEYKSWGGSGVGITPFWSVGKLEAANDVNLIEQYQEAIKDLGNSQNDLTKKQMAWNKTIAQGSDWLKASIEVTDDAEKVTGAYGQAVEASEKGIKRMSLASRAAAVGVQVLNAALNMFVNMIASLAISFVIDKIYELATATERERERAIQAGEAATALSEKITDLASEYMNLSEAVKTDESAKESLIETSKELLETLGYEGDEVQKLISDYDSLDESIRKATVSALREQGRSLTTQTNALADSLIDTANDTSPGRSLRNINTTWRGKDSDINHKALNALVEAGYISSGEFASKGMGLNFEDVDLNSVEGIISAYERLGDMMDIVQNVAGDDNEVWSALSATYEHLTDAIKEYEESVKTQNKNAAYAVVVNEALGKELPKTQSEFDSFRQSLVDSADASNTFAGSTEDVEAAIDSVLSSQSEFADFYNTVTATENQASQTVVSVAQQTISKFRGTVEALKQAVAEYSDTGEVTAATYQKVTALGEDYADLFDFTNGKIELQADELDTLAQKLVQEAGATLAANDATTDQIALISKLVSGLRKTEEETEDTLASIKDLVGVLEDAKEGTELSTLAMLDLIMQYPDLADNIIKTTKGYKLEEAAVWELIEAKKEELRINELLVKTKAREALLAGAGTEKTAANVDAIIAKYGEEISSFDDYVKFWETENNKTASGNWIDGYKEYVEASIRDLKYANALDKIIDDLNAENYLAGITPSKSSSEKEETEFEKAYKKHQHLLNMDQESVEDYLAWLNTAYQNAYTTGQIELDDYYKYQEEVYDKLKTVFNDSLGDTEHQIDLLSRQDGTEDEIISLYKSLQDKVHQQAEHYRSLGLDDNHELIQELQNQWWSYYDNINDIRQKKFDEYLDISKHEIDVLSADSGNIGQIVDSWKNILSAIHAEIEYYTSLGYKETDEVIRNLVEEAISAKDSLLDAIDEVVSECDSAVEGFQNVYTTLTDAAKEYASTGTLSVDSLREILALSPKYLDFLLDENGELVVNKQAIQNVIAARTEELAVENALAYVKKILLAVEQNDIKMLAELTDAAASASSSTWDLVYATLGYAKAIGATKGMDASYFENAADYISKMQSLTKTATNSIEAYYETLEDGYVSQKDGLEQILQLTQDLIKWENEQQIKALEDEKDAYSDIIDNKKEMLRITKEQADRERSVGDKLEAIAKLQAKISQLSLDDSREAQAQKRTLEEELAELQKELADEQSSYSYEVQEEALDKELEAFEETKDDEIEALENMLGSAEQLYQAAIARIEEDWDGLYSDLLSWNENYGSVLQSELVSAWDAASEAVQRYGSFVNALEGVDNDTNLGEHTGAISGSYGSSNAGDYGSATSILSAMKRNSLAWFTASDSERKSIEAAQKDLANEWKNTFGETLTSKNGSWYREDGSLLYRLSNDEVGSAIVDKMKENADAWHTTSDTQAQQALAKENEKLAKLLSGYIGQQITKSRDGTWWLGSSKLFDVYHDGGIVGEKSKLKSNEVIAKLEAGELIIPKKPAKSLLDMMYDSPSPHTRLVNGMIQTNPSVMDAVENITNNNDNSDSSVRDVTVNNETHIHVQEKLDKEDIRKLHREIGEAASDYITEGFTTRGIKKRTSLF